ncbi:hypothetical protein [Pseudonocardia adelaidensis]|uniref:Uncharacterized protein n=1 Tax=Pseudonocardia adelaidensis TaxID=648754 RepID=A0ABP9NKV1_9PSEU
MGRAGTLRRRTEPRAVRLLRGFSGVLAGGLVALAVALLVAGVVAQQRAVPGPGAASIGGHVVAAVAAVVLQRRADRSPAAQAAGWAFAVMGLTAVVLAVLWLV